MTAVGGGVGAGLQRAAAAGAAYLSPRDKVRWPCLCGSGRSAAPVWRGACWACARGGGGGSDGGRSGARGARQDLINDAVLWFALEVVENRCMLQVPEFVSKVGHRSGGAALPSACRARVWRAARLQEHGG